LFDKEIFFPARDKIQNEKIFGYGGRTWWHFYSLEGFDEMEQRFNKIIHKNSNAI